MPLANTSVTLAGQGSKVGGTVARVFGWVVLAAGLFFALALAGILLALGASGLAAGVIGGPIALISAVVAYALLRGGKELKKSGDEAEQATKLQALFALANTRGGVLTAADVAQMLAISAKEGDDVLTKLAKENPEQVQVDVDDNGNILYRFTAANWKSVQQRTYTGGMAPNAVPPHVRVGAAPPPTRVDVREPLEDEVDEAEPAAARRRAR
jgi:hypothetical protein